MTLFKLLAGIFISIVVSCNGQFLTPDQLREQHDLGYAARTHYEVSGGRRTDMFNRLNPDYLLRGFFPFWSIVLIAFALVFLSVSIIGILGYLLGCRRPTPDELIEKELRRALPDNELLLRPDLSSNVDDLNPITDEYTNNQYSPYKSSPLAERARIGHGSEDMV